MKPISDFKIRTIDRRSHENRREYTYTEYIPERRSGKDRRRGKKGKNSFGLQRLLNTKRLKV
jgi:hypothetical protein